MKVAIVGAGVSGLSLAYFLLTRNSKLKISLFEKSGSLGGRMATRRIGHGLIVDTGCQYLSFDQEESLDFLLRTAPADSLKALPQPILCLPDGWLVDPQDRFYFPDGMDSWVKNIFKHVHALNPKTELHLESEIKNCRELFKKGFEHIFVTVPGFEAERLGSQKSPEYQSCMTLIFSWNTPDRNILEHFAYRDLSQREGITWLSHEGMKRNHPEIWLAQVSSQKSQELAESHQNSLDDFLRSDMAAWISAFAQGEKTLLDHQFWKAAFPVSFVDPAEQTGFEKVETQNSHSLYFLGDGYLGVGRVENAVQSAFLTSQNFFKTHKI